MSYSDELRAMSEKMSAKLESQKVQLERRDADADDWKVFDTYASAYDNMIEVLPTMADHTVMMDAYLDNLVKL